MRTKFCRSLLMFASPNSPCLQSCRCVAMFAPALGLLLPAKECPNLGIRGPKGNKLLCAEGRAQNRTGNPNLHRAPRLLSLRPL